MKNKIVKGKEINNKNLKNAQGGYVETVYETHWYNPFSWGKDDIYRVYDDKTKELFLETSSKNAAIVANAYRNGYRDAIEDEKRNNHTG